MLFLRPEKAQTINVHPYHQMERCIQTHEKNEQLYLVTPILVDNSMPIVVVRVEKEKQLVPSKYGVPHVIVEYQYGILPTTREECYEIDDDDEMETRINEVFDDYIAGEISLLPIYFRESKSGIFELKVNRKDVVKMKKHEGIYWIQVLNELSEKISSAIATDRRNIKSGKIPAETALAAIKEYKQITANE